MTSCVAQANYEKFIKGKLEYTRKELLKKMPKEYHSMINVFMKCDTDMLPKHRDKDHSIQLEEGKNPPFIQNYKPLSTFRSGERRYDQVHPGAFWERLHLT